MKCYVPLAAVVIAVIGCSSDSASTLATDDDPNNPNAASIQPDPATGSETNNNATPTNGASGNVPDPGIQNTTSVRFEAVVPAYQSDALQLTLEWGEFNTSLSWVGDEFWATDLVLPTDTEEQLLVSFYDENGGIKLGSFEQPYKTGINAGEVIQITADQFETERWDFDADTISNLDELIQGTNPRADEYSLLPSIDNQKMSILFFANYFESLMPSARPYMGTDTVMVNDIAGTSTTANIDENGNGNLRVDILPESELELREANRLVLDNSVQWSGGWYYSNDFYLDQTFTSEISVDADTYRLVETGNGSWRGTGHHVWDTSVDVTGQPIEGTAYCEVTSGTITEFYDKNHNGRYSVKLTITKASSEAPWRVVEEFDNGSGVVTTEIKQLFFCKFGNSFQLLTTA
jgi:hypothetical protein